jgi:hypothetical protein
MKNKSNIISRDSSGTIFNTEGKKVCKVPSNVSMLSVLGSENQIVKDGDYCEDGWIRVNGKPVKRWIRKVYGLSLGNYVNVWEPKLDNIVDIESKYWKVHTVYNKFHKNNWLPAIDNLKKVKKAHSRVYFKYHGDQDPWYLWEYGGVGFSFSWVKKPRRKLNPNVGQQVYEAYIRSGILKKREQVFRIALEAAFIKELDKKTGSVGAFLSDRVDKTICFVVNGRSYWFISLYTTYGSSEWSVLRWSTDEVETYKLN